MSRAIIVPLVTFVSWAAIGCEKGPKSGDGFSKEEIAAALEGIEAGETREFADGTAMTMHRMQVDDRDDTGWQRAVSTMGNFSVELPVPYNDFRTVGPASDGASALLDAIGGATPGQLKWSATCISRSDGKHMPEAPKPGTDETEELGAPPTGYSRRVVFEGRTCLAIIEAQGTDPLPAKASVDRFLGSLKVSDPLPSRPSD